MKYWEICKSIDEGSPSVYVHESGCTPSFIIEKRFMDGWTEVKQSVTWQEALEAWSVGKTVKCIHDNVTFIYKPTEIENGDTYLVEKYDDPLTLKEIKYGTWYIEN